MQTIYYNRITPSRGKRRQNRAVGQSVKKR
jgi:hypothetical protein